MVMAGGSGTRLWPLSRKSMPKQLLPLIGGRSLLELAVDRMAAIVPSPAHRWICASCEYAQIIQDKLSYPARQVLAEPAARDTLNAVGLTAAVLAKTDPHAVFAVLTADHIIEPVDVLVRAFNAGFELVEADPHTIVTFSIKPTHPATGYGYIEQGERVRPDHSSTRDSHAPPVFHVKRYVEKPDLPTAQAYLAAGNFGWSSGMFIVGAQLLSDLIRTYQPMCAKGLEQIAAAWATPAQQAVLDEVYPTLPRISIDYAIMEPAARAAAAPESEVRGGVVTIPLDLRWLDVGSWTSLAETLTPDGQGHRTIGSALHEGGRNVLAVSDDPGHLIATIGCENLIIVHTGDATLVCPAERAQDIKRLVDRLPPERK